ncbi:hypothetical protein MINS_02950 [Mycolicibacterium insubricum]|nr:hypothetical protein MINS_02950 [Mycolicibacterium insubricum]
MTTATVSVGVVGLVAAALVTAGTAGAEDGVFSGTYVVAPWGDTIHVTSKCAHCNAVATGRVTQTLTWNGAGWTNAFTIEGCGPVTTTGTATAVADGYVQELQVVGVGACPAANTTATWSRVGP